MALNGEKSYLLAIQDLVTNTLTNAVQIIEFVLLQCYENHVYAIRSFVTNAKNPPPPVR